MKISISKQAIGVLALLCSSAGMAATVEVIPTPSGTCCTQIVSVGNQFTVTVSGAAFPDTAGATLGITWNAAVVSFVSGALPASGQWAGSTGAFYVPHPNASNPSTFDLLAGSPTPTGNFGPAVVFTFNAIAPGAANILITDNQNTLAWFDANTFEAIPVTYTQANVTVAAVPVPAAAWLLMSALGSLAGLKRLRRQ